MARQKQVVEFNQAVQGIVTEASPLNFPPMASRDESNFILNKDGSRNRRYGIDKSTEYGEIDIASTDGIYDRSPTTATWSNVGGKQGLNYSCISLGNVIYIFDSFSLDYIDSIELTSSTLNKVSMTSVDGYLIIADGSKSVKILYTDDDGNITETSKTLKVRDTFGVESICTVDGELVDVNSPEYVDRWLDPYNILSEEDKVSDRFGAPTLTGGKHLYNIRNQGFNRLFNGVDPLIYLHEGNKYWTSGPTYLTIPSNSATFPEESTADIKDDSNNNDLIVFYRKNEIAKEAAAKGAFIIDLLDRGSSRESSYYNCSAARTTPYIKTSPFSLPITLPKDYSTSGPLVVGQYAGRVFYAGFTDEVVDGDSRSPKLSSYVAYSQVINSLDDINRCYASGDPTNTATGDLLDTDGGLIRIGGARRILNLVSVSNVLLVFCENGVWSISGGSDSNFTATTNFVSKVTDRGAISQESIVEVDGNVMYWAEDGIYVISINQSSGISSQNITTNTIQRLYDEIPYEHKEDCVGIYDGFERKVHWVYGININLLSTTTTKELIFDATSGAFSKYEISNPDAIENVPRVLGMISKEPYKLSSTTGNVVVGSDNVVADTSNVVSSSLSKDYSTRETVYVTVSGDKEDNIINKMFFSKYTDTGFIDWNYTGLGNDAEAYLLTSFYSAGDNIRQKQAPHIMTYFNITEKFYGDDEVDTYIYNESSCLIQSQWDFTYSIKSNKWGREFQAYRLKRFAFPENPISTYAEASGMDKLYTKNKLRGCGKSLSLKFSTEAGKDLQLLGWALEFDGSSNV